MDAMLVKAAEVRAMETAAVHGKTAGRTPMIPKGAGVRGGIRGSTWKGRVTPSTWPGPNVPKGYHLQDPQALVRGEPLSTRPRAAREAAVGAPL